MNLQQRGAFRIGVSILAFLLILLVFIDKLGIVSPLSRSFENLNKIVEQIEQPHPVNGRGSVAEILWAFILATLLGGIIAYRGKLSRYQFSVLQAHMILSVSAALMMIIIGSELARAFGILGAAGIVRYRYRLVSAREASSLIVALGVGLACGTGLYALAVVATLTVVFILNLRILLPQKMVRMLFGPQYAMQLKCTVATDKENAIREKLENLFREQNIEYIATSTKYRAADTPQTDLTFETSDMVKDQQEETSQRLLDLGTVSFSWKRLGEE
ncbi:MAG: MgtC/SapB family protein [Ignavibacteriae bacterium]|nr:MgtC/SapB family protein [Ignavibacteriota bacterium]